MSFLLDEHYSHWNDEIPKFQDLLGMGFYRNKFLCVTDIGIYLRSIDGECDAPMAITFCFNNFLSLIPIIFKTVFSSTFLTSF